MTNTPIAGSAAHNHAAHNHTAPADHHAPRQSDVERRCDVCVVGGSAAGLAAALQIVRQQRSVIVVDDGSPRNAPAAHMHGYLGHEAVPPSELLDKGRGEVRNYGGEVVRGRATQVTKRADGLFRVDVAGGGVIVARRVVAATGISDLLPDIDGLAEQWGRGVIHCPFCHGYEVRGRRLVLIATHPAVAHSATLFRHLTDRLTIVLGDETDHDDTQAADTDHAAAAPAAQEDDSPAVSDELRASGVTVVRGRVTRIVTGSDGRVAAVDLADGRRIDADAAVILPQWRVRIEPFVSLGLTASERPGFGAAVDVDEVGRTAVDGLYAVGSLTEPGQQVLLAAAHGSRVGAMVAYDLASADLHSESVSANEFDWDLRYSGEQIWSGEPNGTLVAEVSGWTPGTALDVGAGEGGDAIYLAEQGWDVAASDISARALDRIREAADRRGVEIRLFQADANALDPFGADQFDLVSAHYASIPRSPDRRAVRSLMGAVARGGSLLMVSHDLSAVDESDEQHQHSARYDPDAYVRVSDVVHELAGDAEWVIDVHETRRRPAGGTGHHVADVVLRAHRIA